MKYLMLGLTAFLLAQSPSFAGEGCSCSKGCMEKCSSGKDHKCKCKSCECSKTHQCSKEACAGEADKAKK